MSKPRDDWWVSVKTAVRAYPGRKKRLEELRRTAVTPGYGSTGGMGGVSSPTEKAVLRALPEQQQRELEAVEAAIRQTGASKKGQQKLRLIELYHFKRTHSLIGAGIAVGYGEAQAKRVNGEFIRLVAYNLGYIEKNLGNDTPEPKNHVKVIS